MEEDDAGLLADHVLMDCDHIDAGGAQGVKDGLQLALAHREVAIDDGVVFGSGEGSPRVHSHSAADVDIVHPGGSGGGEFVDAFLEAAVESEDGVEARGIERGARGVDWGDGGSAGGCCAKGGKDPADGGGGV